MGKLVALGLGAFCVVVLVFGSVIMAWAARMVGVVMAALP